MRNDSEFQNFDTTVRKVLSVSHGRIAAGLYLEDQHMVSHRLRDTFAVSMLEQGVPMEEVARMLGNSLKVCEKHYAKWVQARQNSSGLKK